MQDAKVARKKKAGPTKTPAVHMQASWNLPRFGRANKSYTSLNRSSRSRGRVDFDVMEEDIEDDITPMSSEYYSS